MIPLPLTPKFEEALVYAVRAHNTQRRKGSGIPYIAHLLAVTALVLENGGNETEAIAALLHDAAEDSGGLDRLSEITELFGPEVAQIVADASDTYEIPKPPFRERKQAHLDRMRQSGDEARVVLLADKVHNARSLLVDYLEHKESLWERFSGGREGTLWYYHSALDALDRHDRHPLWLALQEAVLELDTLVRLDTPTA